MTNTIFLFITHYVICVWPPTGFSSILKIVYSCVYVCAPRVSDYIQNLHDQNKPKKKRKMGTDSESIKNPDNDRIWWNKKIIFEWGEPKFLVLLSDMDFSMNTNVSVNFESISTVVRLRWDGLDSLFFMVQISTKSTINFFDPHTPPYQKPYWNNQIP